MSVTCPKCGGSDIREKNVAYAEIRVTAWEDNGPDGLSPAEWDWDVDVEWEAAPDEKSYVCHHGANADGERCDWQGDLHELVVGPSEDDDDL